jgi:hypothetical protein
VAVSQFAAARRNFPNRGSGADWVLARHLRTWVKGGEARQVERRWWCTFSNEKSETLPVRLATLTPVSPAPAAPNMIETAAVDPCVGHRQVM